MKKFWNLVQSSNESADIYIYGDITSWPWLESDVSSYNLARQLQDVTADNINVYINSCGGEVSEGLAIYNALKRHSAKVTTVCDGFACSAASVIFMAGDERIMSPVSLLMIHNAWSYASGNANQLRKLADDLDTITQASINAYMLCVNLDESKVKELLDEETWIAPQDAVDWGFATTIGDAEETASVSQSAKTAIFHMLTHSPETPPAPPEQNKIEKMMNALTGARGE